MIWMVITNGRVHAESSDEEAARGMANDLALNGAPAVLAQKVAECLPFPQPQWTEVAGDQR